MGKSSFIPGFRFHPTDVELVMFYLKRKLTGKKIYFDAVADVDIYAFSPWDLPDKSSLKSGDLEWYFFCPKAKKYSSGCRAKRATDTGFWKATGKDRQVKYNERLVAVIKTLIYHIGHAGKGERTDWVMHEYRMQDEQLAGKGVVLDSFVLCKIFEKSGAGPKNGAQYGKPFNEEEWEDVDLASCADFQVQGLVGASNMTDHKQKGPATSSVTEPGSSGVTLSANEPTEALNCKEKGKAVDCLSITEVGSSSMMVSATGEMPADYDVMSLEDILEDIELVMKADDGEKGKASNGDSDSIYDDLLNLIDLDDSKLDGVEYTLDDLLADVPPYLEDFYVD